MTGNNRMIGFDLDGVIIDHTANKLAVAEHYGVTLTPPETHAERMGAFFRPDVYKEVRDALYNEAPPALDANLMKGAFFGLSRLTEEQIPFVLISLRQDPLAAVHLLELRELWGDHFTPENTHFVRTIEEKYETARKLGVTHFVDDEPEILKIMTEIQHRICFDEWDQFHLEKPLLRVETWEELVGVIIEGKEREG